MVAVCACLCIYDRMLSIDSFGFVLHKKRLSTGMHHQSYDTSRSSMTLIQSEDATLLALSQDIDHHTSQLRNDVLQSIASIRSKLHQQTAEAMEHQQIVSQATEQRLIQQIENLQGLLETRTSELARERALTERLVDAQFVQKRRQDQRDAALGALRAWRAVVKRERDLKLIGDKAIKERQERDARNAFVTWRLQSVNMKHEKVLEATVAEHKRSSTKATHERQAAENAAKIEILALKEKVAHEEERRALLEEKLKAAFMRGVCALNLEAMQVLRNTTEAGMVDTSVASFMEQLNVSGVQTAPFGVDGSSDDAATLARLLQRQQSLAQQMSAMQSSSSLQPHATSPLDMQPRSEPVVTRHSDTGVAGVVQHQRQQPARTVTSSTTTTTHQAFTVSVNPTAPVAGAISSRSINAAGSAQARLLPRPIARSLRK